MPDAHYRITDWPEHYETSETRKIKRLSWVPIPNAQGDGYLDLVEAHGAVGLGVWVSLVQDASKTHRSKRDGTIRGSIRQIARRSRIPSGEYPDVLRTLTQIGWLEELTDSSGDHPDGIRTASGQPPREGRNEEGLIPEEAAEPAGAAGARPVGSDTYPCAGSGCSWQVKTEGAKCVPCQNGKRARG